MNVDKDSIQTGVDKETLIDVYCLHANRVDYNIVCII